MSDCFRLLNLFNLCQHVRFPLNGYISMNSHALRRALQWNLNWTISHICRLHTPKLHLGRLKMRRSLEDSLWPCVLPRPLCFSLYRCNIDFYMKLNNVKPLLNFLNSNLLRFQYFCQRMHLKRYFLNLISNLHSIPRQNLTAVLFGKEAL